DRPRAAAERDPGAVRPRPRPLDARPQDVAGPGAADHRGALGVRPALADLVVADPVPDGVGGQRRVHGLPPGSRAGTISGRFTLYEPGPGHEPRRDRTAPRPHTRRPHAPPRRDGDAGRLAGDAGADRAA